jgi:hypothetical protein
MQQCEMICHVQASDRCRWQGIQCGTQAARCWTGLEDSSEVTGERQLDDAVVKKLKELNVIFAETVSGAVQQMAARAKGEGSPTVLVKDEFDTQAEVGGLKAWAIQHLKKFRMELSTHLVPKGVRRPLPPLVR